MITVRTLTALAAAGTCAAAITTAWPKAAAGAARQPGAQLFLAADGCFSCHTGITTATGEDISFGSQWRASMMANSARDPYWQAAVRREVLDHPHARAEIEDECSACHMPMMRYQSRAGGHEGQVFAQLPIGSTRSADALLAADGVSCTVCHQITPERLGERASFGGGFVVDSRLPLGERRIFGPYEVDRGRQRIMHSSSGFVPAQATHLASSELCATCHTLITKAFDAEGRVAGELPEQVPYLEWRHSSYRDHRSCQSCHMPEVDHPVVISAVWGMPRERVSRHHFNGSNAFMTRMLARHRQELGVVATPQELDAAAARITAFLERESASLWVARAGLDGPHLLVDLVIDNRAGHKLPTAYPSRRAWLHVVVRDRSGAVVFESGAQRPDGAIVGNANDEDPARFEPHHLEITAADQVQIYESIMVDSAGRVTTGLLSGVRYAKDNRLLPSGFDKSRAPAEVAVHGAAAEDPDFGAGGDRIRYRVPVNRTAAPFVVEAELRYQTIGFRWADNLRAYDAPEPRRFVRYYDSMATSSSERLARTTVTVPADPVSP